MPTLTQSIDTLFVQIVRFESGASDFSTDAFAGNLDGILSAFEMLQNNPSASADIDEVLYRKIREVEPSQSVLRFAVTNILATFLFAWASGGNPRSYQELARTRPNHATADADFIERVFIPRLLDLRGLRGDARLGSRLLLKLADYLETFRMPDTFPPTATRADLQTLQIATLLLGFARRRLRSPGRLLRKEGGSQEYGLERERFFEWMAEKGGPDVAAYLGELQLLDPISWWRRLLNAIGGFFRKLGSAIGAGVRRLPASGVLGSAFWILVAIIVVLAVPALWFRAYERKVKKFAEEARVIERVEVIDSAEGTR